MGGEKCHFYIGALDGGGGVPMSPVDFIKCQRRMSLSLI